MALLFFRVESQVATSPWLVTSIRHALGTRVDMNSMQALTAMYITTYNMQALFLPAASRAATQQPAERRFGFDFDHLEIKPAFTHVTQPSSQQSGCLILILTQLAFHICGIAGSRAEYEPDEDGGSRGGREEKRRRRESSGDRGMREQPRGARVREEREDRGGGAGGAGAIDARSCNTAGGLDLCKALRKLAGDTWWTVSCWVWGRRKQETEGNTGSSNERILLPRLMQARAFTSTASMDPGDIVCANPLLEAWLNLMPGHVCMCFKRLKRVRPTDALWSLYCSY
eukprot:1152503-Pelagomonas_calceolata.AAC.1